MASISIQVVQLQKALHQIPIPKREIVKRVLRLSRIITGLKQVRVSNSIMKKKAAAKHITLLRKKAINMVLLIQATRHITMPSTAVHHMLPQAILPAAEAMVAGASNSVNFKF